MKMDSQFRLICLQVHISDWKLSLDLGAPSSNESLASRLSEMASDKNSLEDLNSSFRKSDRYTLNMDTVSGLTQPYSCSGKPKHSIYYLLLPSCLMISMHRVISN
ncbi:hypothetical protein LINGRAHAP2_LOCUS5167 [Linum grandiflorum]